jgi:lysophospholipase L1-like esterase
MNMRSSLSFRIVALALGLFVSSGGPLLAQMAEDASQYPTNSALLPGVGPTNYWNGLPRVWAQRHAQWAKTAQGDTGAVVFLGDSITQGWNSLATDFPNMKVANRGIGGDTTRGVLYRLRADVLSLMPRAIVLLIGTNDVGNGATPQEVAANIQGILKAIRIEDPTVPVIVCEVMPSSEKQNRPADKIEAVNALIKKDMSGKANVYVCDTWSIFADAQGDCTPDIFHDLLHPNAAGYEKWKEALNPIFAKLNLQTGE